jgi:phosphoribosylformylglycinamidine synthase subunit PurQ / glutaminase
MKIGVVVFPGSNCDHDTYHVLKHVCGQEARFVWHKDSDLGGLDAVVLPGGFSYGDYLRTGAIARFSPVMQAVTEFAGKGGPVLGICNGFQILQEAGLLPGAMLRNGNVKFLSQPVSVRVERSDTIATSALEPGTVLTMPIAHGDGNFYLPDDELDRLEGEGQVVFRYSDRGGRLTPEANPNRSARSIAGVCNRQRNVVGLMPHPERASELELGSTDGRRIFESLIHALQAV